MASFLRARHRQPRVGLRIVVVFDHASTSRAPSADHLPWHWHQAAAPIGKVNVSSSSKAPGHPRYFLPRSIPRPVPADRRSRPGACPTVGSEPLRAIDGPSSTLLPRMRAQPASRRSHATASARAAPHSSQRLHMPFDNSRSPRTSRDVFAKCDAPLDQRAATGGVFCIEMLCPQQRLRHRFTPAFLNWPVSVEQLLCHCPIFR